MTTSARLARPGARAIPHALLALALTGAVSACGQHEQPTDGGAPFADGAAPVSTEWMVEAAVELGEKLGGVTLADLDPERAGDEIAVVGASGRVWSVAWVDGAWVSEQLAHLPGEGIVVVGGQLDDRPGDELVVGGMAQGGEDDGGEGSLRLLTRGPDGWSVEELHRAPALVHGVCLVDWDGDGQDEVAAAGFGQRLVLARRGADGWSTEDLGELPAAAKSLVPWGAGVALALTDGQVLAAAPSDDGCDLTEVDRILAGRARLATDEEHLLIASDDGSLVLASAGPARSLHRSSDKLRGAALANLLPGAPGLEAATVGYDGRVVVLSQLYAAVEEQVVHTEGDRLHHLASGTVSARGAGVFLVAVGYSGRVLVLRGPGW